MASTVASFHFPLGVPSNDPSFPSACCISETRSGVGAFCPFSRALARVFFDERCALLPVEELEPLEALCAAARHTPSPAATSSASPKTIVLLKRIQPRKTGTKFWPVIIVCCPPAPHPTKTPSECARYRRAGEP